MPSLPVQFVILVLLIGIYLGIRSGFLKRLLAGEVELRRKRGKLTEKSIWVGPRQIWYDTGGPRHPTVLLLHGFAGDKNDWTPLAELLIEEGFGVYAPDLPGFGKNDKVQDDSYDPTTLIKVMRGFARGVRLERFHMVGHSLGAMIAAGYAYASPMEVLSLTLIEPFGVRVPYPSELDAQLEKGRNPLIITQPELYGNLISFMTAKKPSLSSAVLKQRGRDLATHHLFYRKVWEDIREDERANLLEMVFAELQPPVLSIAGERSRVVHPSTVALLNKLDTRSKAVVMKGCGHLPMVEQPAECAKHVVAFLKKH